MKIIYRISDGGHPKNKPYYVTKRGVFLHFIKIFREYDIYIVADNVTDDTLIFLSKYSNNILRTNFGNGAGSFIYAVEFAINTFSNNPEEDIYFAEDDYIYTKNAPKIIKEGLTIADYSSGYDHPDKYINTSEGGPNPFIKEGGEETRVILSKNSHWKITNSCCMTFATKVKTLKEDINIYKTHCTGTYPRDFYIFLDLKKKNRKLVSSIPSVSTHGETAHLAHFINWEQEFLSTSKNLNISLYNSFPFHYEIFGCFINYCVYNNYNLTIYTNFYNNLGWIDFYKSLYTNITFKNFQEFTKEVFNASNFVILGTDDDKIFKVEEFMKLNNAQNKLLCYDHDKHLRTPNINKHFGTRPFLTTRSLLPFVYPVYPIVSKNDKLTILNKESTINITIVGSIHAKIEYLNYLDIDWNFVNFKYIGRDLNQELNQEFINNLSKICKNTEFIKNCDALLMIDILKKSHYVMFATCSEKYVHNSTSGALGLAFSTGCQIVMPKIYNTEYQFKSVLYFEDRPKISRVVDLDKVYAEYSCLNSNNINSLDKLLS